MPRRGARLAHGRGAGLDAERSVGALPEILPGVDQLSDSNGPRVRAAIVAFLRANAR